MLALETSGNACSAALLTPTQCYTRFEPTQRAHTQLLLPMVDDLLQEAKLTLKDIDCIAAGQGPGSFTGVRIAISAAQGLAYGLSVPVFPVCTLSALAYQAQINSQVQNTLIVSAIDARMHEIYAAAFISKEDYALNLLPACLIKPADLLKALPDAKSLIAIGSGWDTYFDEITHHAKDISIYTMPNSHVNALHIGLIAKAQIASGKKGVAAKEVIPVYLRDNVASPLHEVAGLLK